MAEGIQGLVVAMIVRPYPWNQTKHIRSLRIRQRIQRLWAR